MADEKNGEVTSETLRRVTEAASHLRRAVDIVADLDASPGMREVAIALDVAASAFDRFLEVNGSRIPGIK